MAIEIFGFTVTDIATIGALFATAFTFWFGYSRTRKSEQIKIANEIMTKIDSNAKDILNFSLNQPVLKYDPKAVITPERKMEIFKFTQKIIITIGMILQDIEYFNYLVQNKEINSKVVLSFYASDMIIVLASINTMVTGIKDEWKKKLILTIEQKQILDGLEIGIERSSEKDWLKKVLMSSNVRTSENSKPTS